MVRNDQGEWVVSPSLKAELEAKAAENVKDFPPLTDEQIAVVRWAFGDTLRPKPAAKQRRQPARPIEPDPSSEEGAD